MGEQAMKYEKAQAMVILFDHNEFMANSGTWTDPYGNQYICGGVTKGSGDWYNCKVFKKLNKMGEEMQEMPHGFSCSLYELP